jgi:hypothetical protein
MQGGGVEGVLVRSMVQREVWKVTEIWDQEVKAPVTKAAIQELLVLLIPCEYVLDQLLVLF